MNLDVVLLSKFRNMIYRLAEEIHVVEVERCRNLVESLYCIDIQHIDLSVSVKFLTCLKIRGKRLQK